MDLKCIFISISNEYKLIYNTNLCKTDFDSQPKIKEYLIDN